METMESWDIALLVVVGYLAAVALVRLMTRHRDQLVGQFRREMQQQRKPQPAEKAEPAAHRRAG